MFLRYSLVVVAGASMLGLAGGCGGGGKKGEELTPPTARGGARPQRSSDDLASDGTAGGDANLCAWVKRAETTSPPSARRCGATTARRWPLSGRASIPTPLTATRTRRCSWPPS